MTSLIMYIRCVCIVAAVGIIGGHQAVAQENAEALRLPEVVITGADQTKILRELPQIDVTGLPFPEFTLSAGDESRQIAREGRMALLVQPNDAEQRFQQAIALNPANALAYQGLGDAYRALGQYAKAIETYQHALELAVTLPDVHYALGILYESQMKDAQHALANYRAYLRDGGTDPRVSIWIRNLERQAPEAGDSAGIPN